MTVNCGLCACDVQCMHNSYMHQILCAPLSNMIAQHCDVVMIV